MVNKLFSLLDSLIAKERSIEKALGGFNAEKNSDFLAIEFDLLEEMIIQELFGLRPRVCRLLLENARDLFWDYEDGKISKVQLMDGLNVAAKNIENDLNSDLKNQN